MFAAQLVVLIGVSLGLALSPCLAQDPYYKGKRLTVLINFDAGSAPDIEGRLFARHFAKHIDGQPQIIVQNISGAGGVNGTQYLGEIAPKDGTTFGYLTGSAWNFASQPQLFRVDYRKYEFVGFQGGTVVYYVRTDVPPGIKQPDDILKAKGLVSGGIAATTGRDLAIRLTLDILGVPFRHVTGYRSGERVQLAIQRGEVNFSAATTPGYRGTIEPTMVKQGNVIPLFVDPMWDGRTFSNSKQVEGLVDRTVPGVLQTRERRGVAFRHQMGDLSGADDAERHDATAVRAATWRASGRRCGIACGTRPSRARQSLCGRCHQDDRVCTGIRGRA